MKDHGSSPVVDEEFGTGTSASGTPERESAEYANLSDDDTTAAAEVPTTRSRRTALTSPADEMILETEETTPKTDEPTAELDEPTSETDERDYSVDANRREWTQVVGSRDLAVLRNLTNQKPALVHDAYDKGSTLLHLAACCGYTEEAQFLLASGADINVRDKNNDTALHHAIAWCHDELARVLIDNNADVSAVGILGDTALHCASVIGQPELIRAILAQPIANAKIGRVPYIELMDQDRYTALAICFYYSNNLETVKLLLQAGANPASLELHPSAPSSTHSNSPPEMPIFQLVMESCPRWHAVDSECSTLLHTACRLKNADFCNLVLDGLVDRGTLGEMLAHRNQFDETALLISVRLANLEICRLLLGYGADAQITHAVNNQFELDDITALEWAAGEGHKTIVEAMLKSLDARADISRALYLAASEGELDICRLLLTCGIDIDIYHQTDNLTILQVAAYRGHADVVDLLLMRNLRAWPKEKIGREALRHFICKDKERDRILKALRRHGVWAWSAS
jgi:ankyrin repeat protein